MPEPTPDAWAQIRHDYEHTDRPLAHICAEHDITVPMLRYRIKRWEWRRRKPLVPREGPPPVTVAQHDIAAPPTVCTAPAHPTPLSLAFAPAGDPPPPGAGPDAATIVPRLQSAVARLLAAIEATIARLSAGTQQPREMEQAGRTLSALTRTLRELNALLAQYQARAAEDADKATPPDMETLRHTLSLRLAAIIDSQDKEAKLAET